VASALNGSGILCLLNTGALYYVQKYITAISWRNRNWRNRMRENCSYGSVGERGGNKPLYPDIRLFITNQNCCPPDRTAFGRANTGTSAIFDAHHDGDHALPSTSGSFARRSTRSSLCLGAQIALSCPQKPLEHPTWRPDRPVFIVHPASCRTGNLGPHDKTLIHNSGSIKIDHSPES
jgi:hypothetical protein